MPSANKDSIAEGDLIHQTWAAVSHQRADFYAWFSTIFALEIPETAIAAYQRGEAAVLLRAMHALGLNAEASRVEASLAGWHALPCLPTTLAADFCSLFLLGARESAVPYASAYLDSSRQLYGAPHVRMQAFLRDSGLQVHADFKEPSDHLAVYLCALEKWIRQDAEAGAQRICLCAADQLLFIDDALLSWLPVFSQRCQQIGLGMASDFYPAVAALLHAFLEEDAGYLTSARGVRCDDRANRLSAENIKPAARPPAL